MVAPLTQVPRQEAAVEHADTPLEFWVKSRSESGKAHKVVLADPDWGGADSCTCKWFRTTCGPSIRRGKVMRCYHAQLARNAFTEWVIPLFRAQDKNLPASQQT